MDNITRESLDERYGAEIGELVFNQLVDSIGDLSGFTIIDGALDMQAQQLANEKGLPLEINYRDQSPPLIDGEQIAALMEDLARLNQRGMDR